MDTHKKNREIVSALADDEVPPADQELALAALLTQEGTQAWALYHRIGDALRAGDALTPPPELSPGFAERLAARLDAEPSAGSRLAVASDEAPVK